MAIRFPCKRCQQLLGIASRKAGSEIECPKCGLAQIVPSEEAAMAAMAMNQYAKAPQVGENPANVVVYDDEPTAIETPGRAGEEGPAPPGPARQTPSKQPPPPPGEPVPQGMILFPRRTFYVQAILLVLLAAAAFGAGYLIGLGDARHRTHLARMEAARQEVTIRGKLSYHPGTGRIGLDENAVIIALPKGKYPAKTIPIQDIRPQAVPPPETHRAVRMIKELGGAYARANAQGDFFLTVPDRGQYWILIISAHVRRPQGNEIQEVDLPEMQRYFDLAEHLIGPYKYRFTLEEVDVGFNPIEHDFGRNGQP